MNDVNGGSGDGLASFDAGGLFGDDSDEDKKKSKNRTNDPYAFDDGYGGLLGGSGSDNDSDVDRPPLTEADERRRRNKMRSKIKQ